MGEPLGDGVDAGHVERRRQETRHQPRHQQQRHRLFGQDGVDDHQDARRNERGERAGGRDAAGAEAAVVAEGGHLRQRHLGEDGGVDHGGPAGRAESGRCERRRHGEPAGQPAQPVVGRAVKVGRQPRLGRQRAHQDEQRNDREREGVRGAERMVASCAQAASGRWRGRYPTRRRGRAPRRYARPSPASRQARWRRGRRRSRGRARASGPLRPRRGRWLPAAPECCRARRCRAR